MRRLPGGVGRSIGVLCDPLASPSITPRSCSACWSGRHLPRATAINFSSLPRRLAQRQNTADLEKKPFTERIRQKLWGTDNPPGQDDPYDQRNRGTRAAAETVDDALGSTTDGGETYVPASTWDGLEFVGGSAGWWRQNWDQEHIFNSFTPPERLTSPQALTAALHRAVVEIFTLQQAGRLMGDACNISNNLSEDVTAGVQVCVDERGAVNLDYPDDEVRETILRAAVAKEAVMESPEHVAEEASSEEMESAEPTNHEAIEEDPTTGERAPTSEDSVTIDEKLSQQISSWGTSWLSIPLTDQTLKFYILKRVTHLTGHLISDPLLPTLHTLKNLQSYLITPPPPPKLADALLKNEALTSLPNVKVYSRRVTPIDKEKAVGRWKVIEKELREMGLPVTGHT